MFKIYKVFNQIYPNLKNKSIQKYLLKKTYPSNNNFFNN